LIEFFERKKRSKPVQTRTRADGVHERSQVDQSAVQANFNRISIVGSDDTDRVVRVADNNLQEHKKVGNWGRRIWRKNHAWFWLFAPSFTLSKSPLHFFRNSAHKKITPLQNKISQPFLHCALKISDATSASERCFLCLTKISAWRYVWCEFSAGPTLLLDVVSLDFLVNKTVKNQTCGKRVSHLSKRIKSLKLI